MKNLAIDIGNTLAKVAVFEDNELVGLKKTSVEKFSSVIRKILEEHPQVSQAIVSSVVENRENIIAKLPKNIWVLELTATTPVAFRNLYKTPHTLGIDRIALASGAISEFPNTNVLVIDAGTCITYDMVTKEGEYVGGAISPGVNMRLQAMHNFTSKLPLIHIYENIDNNITGTSTQENLEIGAVFGAALEIDGFIEAYRSKYQHLTVILTGGNGELLSKKVKNSIFAPNNFLLKGLNHILEFNTTK